jgi:hypothetical protein
LGHEVIKKVNSLPVVAGESFPAMFMEGVMSLKK